MGDDDWLELAFDGVTVLPGQHVHLPLVHAQLADISLHGTGCHSAVPGINPIACQDTIEVFASSLQDGLSALSRRLDAHFKN